MSDKRGALTSVYSSVFVDAHPYGFVRDTLTLTLLWVRIKIEFFVCLFVILVGPLLHVCKFCHSQNAP